MTFLLPRSQALQTVPQRKIVEALEQTIRNCDICSKKENVKLDHDICNICNIRNKALKRYSESNIPVKYWFLEMERDFKGDEVLLEQYKLITSNLRKSYQDGVAICLAGLYGRGKTMTVTNVLKRASEKDYSCLYVNLNDVVNIFTSQSSEDRTMARKELLLVDFLVIDEFDPKYMSNDKTSDLFGKILEEIFRTRSQNNLPILMCTNSPNVVESFVGNIKQSIQSLMSCVNIIPVLGKDFRKNGIK